MIHLSRLVSFWSRCLSIPTITLCLNTHFAWAQEQSQSKAYNLATDISDHYTKSFVSEAKEEQEAIITETAKERSVHQVRPAQLDAVAKRKVLFHKILAKSERLSLDQQRMEPILNEYAWDDLKLFYGTTSKPGYHLMSRINRTTTTLGEAALATLLVTPTSNLAVLRQRQHILQALLENHAEVATLKNSFQTYQDAEQSMLSLWTDTDPLYSKEYRDYMNGKFYAKGEVNSNKSAGLLEFKKRFFRDFYGIQLRFLYPLIPPLTGEIFFREELSPDDRKYLWKSSIPYYGGYNKWDYRTEYIRARGRKPSKWALVEPILSEVLYTWSAYTGISNYLEYASVLQNLASRMADVQAFIGAATEISDCIAASPALEAVYGACLEDIRKLLDQPYKDTELGRLVHYLQHLPYQSRSYFFNNTGKLLASHKLFVEHKEAFSDAMYEFGLLDAFLSFATLMQEAQAYDNHHAYVFTQFLDRQQKDRPYVKITDMWNPFLDAKQAVSNSLEMDAAPGGVRNMILTGPNAGGKSTFLAGVANTLLLAHVVGIGPAQNITLTPFNKINTYIDIADDIAAGKSLFMAEVDRAQKHINLLRSLKEHEFSFTISDEPFSGTNPIEGAAAEYSILESLADYTNSLSIVATHYPTVMLLEERTTGKGFANYKVYITRRGLERKLNYTYKIVPGKSNQAIAIDILEEQGYDTQMLKRAREIIEYPERYQAGF